MPDHYRPFLFDVCCLPYLVTRRFLGNEDCHGEIGYPSFIVLPLSIAKLLGVVAILYRRWATLKTFAFAGFLYDLVLATLGHYYHPGVDTGIGLAIFGLTLWISAYLADLYLTKDHP